jgi:catechol 2,3-dioxygenase-like lactoylglutathione lyase family enzyme
MTSLSTTSNLRSFVPARDFAVSRAFYQDLGAKEVWTSANMVLLQLVGEFVIT